MHVTHSTNLRQVQVDLEIEMLYAGYEKKLTSTPWLLHDNKHSRSLVLLTWKINNYA